MEKFFEVAFENLPVIAKHPLALVAYLAVIASWTVIALRTRRFRILLQYIERLPEQDRLQAIQLEIGGIPRSGLSAQKWIRTRIHIYLFSGFLVVCLVAVAIFTVSAFYRSQKEIDPSKYLILRNLRPSISLDDSTLQSGVAIHRVLPLVSDSEKFVGVETEITNQTNQDQWIDEVKLFVKAAEYSPCMGNLHETRRYDITLHAEAAKLVKDPQGNNLRQVEIRGRTQTNSTVGKQVRGFMTYLDNCAVKRWNIEMSFPLDVKVGSMDRTAFQLVFQVRGAKLVEKSVTGQWFSRIGLHAAEIATIRVILQNGQSIEKEFTANFMELLSNIIMVPLSSLDDSTNAAANKPALAR